jgi:UDP-N-acetylglucosamine transferase subunit ALG13
MILVTVGSSTIPFDRLLAAVNELDPTGRIVVQHGASTIRPHAAECVDFVEYEELVELMREAQVVITHGGVGSIMTALGTGKRPVVVPRRQEHGEAVDDHQLVFARRASALGLVTSVEDVNELPLAIERRELDARVFRASQSPLELELRSYLEETLDEARSRPAASLV